MILKINKDFEVRQAKVQFSAPSLARCTVLGKISYIDSVSQLKNGGGNNT